MVFEDTEVQGVEVVDAGGSWGKGTGCVDLSLGFCEVEDMVQLRVKLPLDLRSMIGIDIACMCNGYKRQLQRRSTIEDRV